MNMYEHIGKQTNIHEPCQAKLPFSKLMNPTAKTHKHDSLCGSTTAKSHYKERLNKTWTRVFAALRLLLDIRRSLSATTEGWDSESNRLRLKRSSDAGTI